MKNKLYVTFGWGHTHCIQNLVLDKDCVAMIDNTNQDEIHAYFNGIYSRCFTKKEFVKNMTPEKLEMYYPRGIIHVPENYYNP